MTPAQMQKIIRKAAARYELSPPIYENLWMLGYSRSTNYGERVYVAS